MGDVLPRETENTVYRYLTAISKLRLGILTDKGEGSQELVCFFRSFVISSAWCHTRDAPRTRTRYKGERPAGETISQRRTADEIAHPDEKAADQINSSG